MDPTNPNKKTGLDGNKKFLSKKERIQKKEEERRARQQQERDCQQMGNALYSEVNEFNHKKVIVKRRRSVERNVTQLILGDYQKRKKGLTQSPTMSNMILHGSLGQVMFDQLVTSITPGRKILGTGNTVMITEKMF